MASRSKERGPYNSPGFDLILARNFHTELCQKINRYKMMIRDADPVLEDVLIKAYRIQLRMSKRCEVAARQAVEDMETLEKGVERPTELPPGPPR